MDDDGWCSTTTEVVVMSPTIVVADIFAEFAMRENDYEILRHVKHEGRN